MLCSIKNTMDKMMGNVVTHYEYEIKIMKNELDKFQRLYKRI